MTAKRKRLKKLMQSVGIQRNDFEKELKNMREYDEWDYQTIISWVRNRQNILGCFKISALRKALKPFGIKKGFKTMMKLDNINLLDTLAEKWDTVM
jgi:hypothetical protein